ncbi:MAG: hypothetical protein Fur0032_19630 [Terrimicrobiaceae bacterium]
MGLFLALGLAAIAGVVVYFGRFGDGIRKYYELRVEYPNASGLLKGASVLLAGAKVGVVNTAPEILPDMEGVFVMLRIYEEVKIPSASEFRIGSSGLLGDRFVEIVLLKNAKASPPIKPGSVIQGKGESGGFGALAESAGDMMGDVRQAIENINSVAQKIDSEVLNQETLGNLKKTLENLQLSTTALAAASGQIDTIVKEAEGAFDQAKATMQTADSTLVSGKAAADEFQKAMADIRSLINEIRRGRGPIGTLISDREMANNLKALVQNLRERGILWYRDTKPKPSR